MSDSTKNYGFLTPGLSGAANISVQDGNWEKLDTELIKKVDKESGKGLSTNDFTDEEKQKLSMLFSQTLTPPTLTTTSAEGVAIGADGWTGTGWFCTAADTKYVANDAVDDRIDGFNRFCLKPATDNGEWQNWTPYFDLNGTAYEFFYAPGRALYEALIPSNTQTAAQIVAAIRWENHPPTRLMYGKLTNICGVYNKDCLEFSDTDDTIARYWIKDSSEFRNTTDRITRDEKAVFYGIFMGHYDFSSLDITYLSLLYLSGDLDGNANINLNEAAHIVRHINGIQAQFEIQTIDNF